MSNPIPLAAIDQIVRLQEQCVALAAERDKAVTSLNDAGFTLADGAERWKPPVNERMGELNRRLIAITDERNRLQTALERIARNMKGCAERWEKFPNLRHTELGAIVAAQHIAEAALEKK